MNIPIRCAVDTNVAVTANGKNNSATIGCVALSARSLQDVIKKGHVFIDDGGEIVAEYRNNMSAKGEPGPGDVFLKWLLTNEWSGKRVTRVEITPIAEINRKFDEVPALPSGTLIDPSDQKFIAVARAAKAQPHIIQALDSKWWGWKDELKMFGVRIVFLCEKEIMALHEKKAG